MTLAIGALYLLSAAQGDVTTYGVAVALVAALVGGGGIGSIYLLRSKKRDTDSQVAERDIRSTGEAYDMALSALKEIAILRQYIREDEAWHMQVDPILYEHGIDAPERPKLVI